ncbi:hypothetical protein TRFO_09638 [Tritrichomonas foetus]|uniref:Uncharacterized protein n=1 Tax=Tritrichomonas foetus TaxID=1144522 RepID=A0A1J4JHV9_9EUKA|nr:hypothetical protein TRFO_09638 [Tritrichomonas foetus]|eukprot:OHS97085.1 hypothetical protein TRFO_09638 [Tritrichomonas foetus]
MNPIKPQHYTTELKKTHPSVIDGTINISIENDFVTRYNQIPRHSKPFSKQFLEKVQRDYQTWIDSCNQHEYEEMMKDIDKKEKIYRPERDPYSSSVIKSLPSNFDPQMARIILSKEKHRLNQSKRATTQLTNISNISQVSAPARCDSRNRNLEKLHKNKKFHVGAIETRCDGTIKVFDEALKLRNEEILQKNRRRLLKLDQLDLKNKQDKTHELSQIAKENRDNKKMEMINLGLICNQSWAKSCMEKSSYTKPSTPPRPITANSLEAMNELAQFELKQIQQMKEKKMQKKSHVVVINPDDHFKLTQLPNGSAIYE